MTTAATRDRLSTARQRTGQARNAVKRARDGIDAAQKLGDAQAQQTCEVMLVQAQQELEVAQQLETVLLGQIAGVNGNGIGAESIFDDPSVIRQLEQMAASGMPIGNVMLGPIMDPDQFASYLGGKNFAAAGDVVVPPGSRMQTPYGIVRQLYRPTYLLDLLPTAVMEGGSFTFVIESGSLDSGAAETAEGALKPEDVGLDLSGEGTVTAKTVAAWKKLRRQELDDVAGLPTMINGRLLYLVARRIEAQVLAGDGQGENILGVLNTGGIGSIAFDGAKPVSDLILAGLTTVRLSNAAPTGIVLNPTTYEAMLAAKASGSGERLDSGGAFESPADSIWGCPVIQSSVVPQNKAVVADWGRAVTLFIRQAASIRISDSDQDDFLRNRVTVLAESRVGLATWQPSAICEVALS